ncbi:TPA: hypothetical protein ACX6RV_001267 [Photobacterium damselae]
MSIKAYTLASLLAMSCFSAVSYAQSAQSVPQGNSDVTQSCMGNENLDESGLETCLVNAGNAAKSQVYDLSAQGDKLTSQVEQECAHLKKVTADDADGTKAKVKWATCYANAWSAARDQFLGERY